MIEYIKEAKNKRLYKKEIIWSLIKPLFILGVVPFIFGLYLLLIGIFVDSEALEMAIPLVLCLFFLIIASIVKIISVNKGINLQFKNSSILQYSLSQIENCIQVYCNSTRKTNIYTKKQIKRIIIGKNLIIIILNNFIEYFPKTEELVKVFKDF